MAKVKFVYYQAASGEYFGYLADCPFVWRSAETLEALIRMLRTLHHRVIYDEDTPTDLKIGEFDENEQENAHQ